MVAGSDRARQRLLVLGAGPAQIGLLRAARERDLFVIAVDRDPAAAGFAYADKRAIVSTEDDFFPLAGARAVYQEARAWYGLYNSEEKVTWAIGPGGHHECVAN